MRCDKNFPFQNPLAVVTNTCPFNFSFINKGIFKTCMQTLLINLYSLI